MNRPSALDAVGMLVAAAAMAALFLRAINHFDYSWDSTHYHLVLAAFRAGILTRSDFTPIPLIDDLVYNGYPPLMDFVRGYLWRWTGSINILQVINLLAILALAAFWMLRFGLPPQWTLLAMLSIPVLQIGAPTVYVDVLVNCTFVIALSAFCAAVIEQRALGRNELLVSLLALAIAANTKLLFLALSALLFPVLSAYQIYRLARAGRARELRLFLGLAVIAAGVVFLSGWRNLLLHRNPLYPVAFSILRFHFPGPLPSGIFLSGPEYLDGVPRPLKWLLSVLDFRATEGRDLPYTIDQEAARPLGITPGSDWPRPPSHKMGGFFVPLVLGMVAWLLILTKDLTRGERLRWLLPPALAISVVAVVPGTVDLRYFPYCMLIVIFLCFLAVQRAPASQPAFVAFVLAMFLSLGMLTGWRYFDFSPYSVQDHIRAAGYDKMVTGRDLCFEHRNRDPLLFTYIFHSKGHYRVVDLPPGERCPEAAPPAGGNPGHP